MKLILILTAVIAAFVAYLVSPKSEPDTMSEFVFVGGAWSGSLIPNPDYRTYGK